MARDDLIRDFLDGFDGKGPCRFWSTEVLASSLSRVYSSSSLLDESRDVVEKIQKVLIDHGLASERDAVKFIAYHALISRRHLLAKESAFFVDEFEKNAKGREIVKMVESIFGSPFGE